jgi:hypothetical protein
LTGKAPYKSRANLNRALPLGARLEFLRQLRPPKGMNRKFVDSPVRVTEQGHKCFEHEPGQLVLLPAVEFADGMTAFARSATEAPTMAV